MSQPVSTTNFLVHDANGQPQVIKVVQTSGNKLGSVASRGVIKSIGGGGNVARRIVLEDSQPEATGSPDPLKQRIASVQQGIKIVRGPDGSVTQKTIKLTPSQFQALQSGQAAHGRIAAGQSLLHTSSSASPSSPSPGKVLIKSFPHSVMKRTMSDSDSSVSLTDYKRRRADKLGKGLRHFSMKVCEKVRQKGTTSYNEVADELVAEFTGTPFKPSQEQNYDQKNIRRRVYDALNVLMAMNIISKEKKEIRWIGLPSTIVQANRNSERDRSQRLQRIQHKSKELENLVLQQIAVKNLVERNKEREILCGPPAKQSFIDLPFLVVNTSSKTMVNCSVSNDKKEYLFNFDDKFEIHDEFHVLKGMGMVMGLDKGECAAQDILKARKMVPKSLEKFVIGMSRVASEGDDLSDYSAAAGSSSKWATWDSQGDLQDDSGKWCDDSDTASENELETH